MRSGVGTKTNGTGSGEPDAFIDLETRLTTNDHQALRLWLRLLSCTVRIDNRLRSRLRETFGTTLPRFDLMAQLERNPFGLQMKEISKRLRVSGGNITGITDQLEKEGFVVRTPDSKDRRVLLVQLTDRGLRKFRQIAREHEGWIVQIFEGLTREEKASMFALLKKLKCHLGNAVGPATNADGNKK
jgi:DNA-binding MarR family transcriptional regulator